MKIKALLAILVGALAIHGVEAGTSWSKSPVDSKSQIEYSPDSVGEGSISTGYGSDYLFYGVRLARDHVWADVNYTFDFAIPVNIGVWHLSSLGSGSTGTDAYGDETNLYASIDLPSFLGFDTNLGFTQYFFPTARGDNDARFGDSTSELSITLSRNIAGFNVFYRGAYDFVAPGNLNGNTGIFDNDDNGAWVHTFGLGREVALTDNVSIDLSGGVYYVDNYFGDVVNASAIDGNQSGRSSGWSSYYIKASMPIALNARSTFTPYVGYNGTPDTWVGDGLNGIDASNFDEGGNVNQGANANDVFHWGVSLEVKF